ncbi:hypothetical protein M3210_02775 [Oceanobacillus luteolus]|uniref:hypothetical protein n=1 Tax=Oceanobacillus luteolus TaxID=1274358 RepID=UPI00203FB230|nr:hypothetical protein [Oceanobacillus luteolus]MCM3739186.1 hypothetical protein [Oceanobacillus luteolus]
MKIISIILLIVGVVGLFLSMLMYGDIGIAAGIGSVTAILSGIGFILINKQINN